MTYKYWPTNGKMHTEEFPYDYFMGNISTAKTYLGFVLSSHPEWKSVQMLDEKGNQYECTRS